MKVLFTLDPYTSEGGGAHSFARVLAEHLPALGFEVVFDPAAVAEAVLVFAHIGSPGGIARASRRGATIVHRLDERVDPGERGARRAKHRRLARLNRLADLTIFQSQFVRSNIGPLCAGGPARVIHNGVDRAVFRPDGPRTVLDGEPAVLHVSWSVGESKRFDALGELLARAPAALRLHCVGRHAESGQPWIGDPRVRLHGPRRREEVAALMRGADLLFFPSEFEPCPNTPLEALACGLPLVYHPSGGTPELVGDAGVPLIGDAVAAVGLAVAQGPVLKQRAVLRADYGSAERAVREYADAIRDGVSTKRAAPPPRRRLWILGRS